MKKEKTATNEEEKRKSKEKGQKEIKEKMLGVGKQSIRSENGLNRGR